MKIKIIKSTEPQSWYKEKIGEIFEVLEIDEKNERYIIYKGRVLCSYVDFADCEIIINVYALNVSNMRNINFIEGVNIIAKYLPEKEKDEFGIQAQHDQLWFGAEEWITDENDRNRLFELGWFISESSWSTNT